MCTSSCFAVWKVRGSGTCEGGERTAEQTCPTAWCNTTVHLVEQGGTIRCPLGGPIVQVTYHHQRLLAKPSMYSLMFNQLFMYSGGLRVVCADSHFRIMFDQPNRTQGWTNVGCPQESFVSGLQGNIWQGVKVTCSTLPPGFTFRHCSNNNPAFLSGIQSKKTRVLTSLGFSRSANNLCSFANAIGCNIQEIYIVKHKT